MGPRPAWQPMSPADRSTRLLSEACADRRRRRSKRHRPRHHLVIMAGGIEDSKVLSNRTGCFLRLRPGDRLVARRSLLLVYIHLDRAGIDRECFTANQPSRDARPLKTRRNASLSRKRSLRARQNTE
jgi:hypothetical protein